MLLLFLERCNKLYFIILLQDPSARIYFHHHSWMENDKKKSILRILWFSIWINMLSWWSCKGAFSCISSAHCLVYYTELLKMICPAVPDCDLCSLQSHRFSLLPLFFSVFFFICLWGKGGGRGGRYRVGGRFWHNSSQLWMMWNYVNSPKLSYLTSPASNFAFNNFSHKKHACIYMQCHKEWIKIILSNS